MTRMESYDVFTISTVRSGLHCHSRSFERLLCLSITREPEIVSNKKAPIFLDGNPFSLSLSRSRSQSHGGSRTDPFFSCCDCRLCWPIAFPGIAPQAVV